MSAVVVWSRRRRRLLPVMVALPRCRWLPAWRRVQAGDCQGPEPARGSRGAGRTDDAGGSAIAVAVDLQERAPTGRGAAAAGPPSKPYPGGRIAQWAGYSLQGNRKTKEGDSHPDRD